jgi:hypothetical protein
LAKNAISIAPPVAGISTTTKNGQSRSGKNGWRVNMKFDDLPKMIGNGVYHVHIHLGHLKRWVDENVADMNPDFQRGHVWTEQQQIAFVEWFLAGGITGRDFFFNGPKYLNGGDTDMICVDGLQRMTALLRFVNNEIPAYKVYLKDFEDKFIPLTYCLSINVNNLKTRKEVLQWYLQFNGAGTPHTQEELDRVRALLMAEK